MVSTFHARALGMSQSKFPCHLRPAYVKQDCLRTWKVGAVAADASEAVAPTPPDHLQANQLELIKRKLESDLDRPSSPLQSSSQCVPGVSTYPTLQSSAGQQQALPVHQWGDGSGLTTEQFVAAIQSLPMQQQLRWKSIYPAIGEGSRGRVFQAVNLDTGGMLAVKVVSLSAHMGPGREAALRREALVLELAAMQDYNHPNLLAMQGFCYRPGKKNPQLEIFSELGCCLEDIMPDESQAPLGLALVQKVMTALLSALDFLHTRGVVHRDVKPGNIVSVGRRGTFKLIDMDSMFFAKGLQHLQQQQQQRACLLEVQTEQSQSQQQQQWQQFHMGEPVPQALSTHLAGQAAATVAAAAALELQLQEEQQDELFFDIPGTRQQQQWRTSFTAAAAAAGHGELNALSHAGTPENMAPEAAPVVLEPSVVLWDVLPLKQGKQLPSATPVGPAQDIWSCGTVLWELVMGRPMFDDFTSAEALYQHFEEVRQSCRPCQLLPSIPAGQDPDVVEVLQACLQVDPAKRPAARELLAMKFFTNEY